MDVIKTEEDVLGQFAQSIGAQVQHLEALFEALERGRQQGVHEAVGDVQVLNGRLGESPGINSAQRISGQIGEIDLFKVLERVFAQRFHVVLPQDERIQGEPLLEERVLQLLDPVEAEVEAVERLDAVQRGERDLAHQIIR